MTETSATAASPAGADLPESARRKLRRWRAIVTLSATITAVCLALALALLLWPGAPGVLRIAIGAILAESLLTTVLVGAFGKCPACGESFGMQARRLVPDLCSACGVMLR